MFDRKSDYALNKQDPDAIIFRSVSGVHIRLTRVDFASEEEFQKWKAWSDEDYHVQEKEEHIYTNHTTSINRVPELVLAVQSPDDVLMDKHDRQEWERLLHQVAVGLDQCLTPAQRRRLRLYYMERLTLEEIAETEQVRHQSISECIQHAKKILKKYLKSTLQNHHFSGAK